MNTEKPNGASRQVIERPRNKKELADLLGVSLIILNRMIEAVKDELGEPLGGIYYVNQVVFMANKYGVKK